MDPCLSQGAVAAIFTLQICYLYHCVHTGLLSDLIQISKLCDVYIWSKNHLYQPMSLSTLTLCLIETGAFKGLPLIGCSVVLQSNQVYLLKYIQVLVPTVQF